MVAGELGGRRLVAPDGTSTRPTTDRARCQAVFNSLGSAGVLDGAIVVDLFAGSGAIGIEALSRVLRTACSSNVTALRCGPSTPTSTCSTCATAARGAAAADAATVAATIDADIVFADPPYEFDGWSDLLGRVTSDLVVAESGAEIEPPPGWSVLRAKRYGRTRVTFLERVVRPL